ncbi:transglycosylase SLT domain-containing protein [Patulibacter defluvii]|uniref:transglycosylase SLT domain-containing protein n=1 Tax=Patulibacter defluvii TaxID=3095358 RepID=UPI002A759AEC|nr:transglycosylase SLT domain-containing protein [Patulibacter sp. DM4]
MTAVAMAGAPRATGPTAGPQVVLAPRERAASVGAAVACPLIARRGAVPVVALWDGDPAASQTVLPRPFATGAARRGVARAERCGVAAVARGRMVQAALPADDRQAVAAVDRLAVADGLGPLVVVLAGPWGPPFLPLLVAAGRVHAAGPTAALAACATTLARHGIAVMPAPRATGPLAQRLLRAGWIGRAHVRPTPVSQPPATAPGERGQALLLVLLFLLIALSLAGVLGAVAAAAGGREERQRTVDLAALAAADRMRADWPRRAGLPAALSEAAFRSRAVVAARRTARDNGLEAVAVDFPDAEASEGGPLTVRVRADGARLVAGIRLSQAVTATAELSPPALSLEDAATGAEYRGPLARRDGRPMRPDVALAFDRMRAAARRDGRALTVVSGFRSNAEQARLFAANPNPRMVAPPGRSNHRLGIALDLGPAASYGWLAARAARFGFRKPMAWEPWHWEFTRDPGSTLEAGPRPFGASALPPWVPAAYRAAIRRASVRHRVSAALLAAQLRQESGFDPRAVSPAGAQGIAQFMPGTARAVGLRDPFDPPAAIDAQARLMRSLLIRFGAVQLALAAYNAGEGAVARCHCVPPFPETRHYVAVIIALMRGHDPVGGLADALTIRLVADVHVPSARARAAARRPAPAHPPPAGLSPASV